MGATDFHGKPYDSGTLTKLRIFELYTQEWLPVFLSKPNPNFNEVHIFDFFSGPGCDSIGTYGSPLRILDQLRKYKKQNLAGWGKSKIVVHFFEQNRQKSKQLSDTLEAAEWKIPGVQVDCRPNVFKAAFEEHTGLLESSRAAKLLIIDQCGVDEVSDHIFNRLISLPVTDFIFFLSSSTLHRFRDHPNIKQKIEIPEDSYDVHREAFEYYRRLVPSRDQVYLGRFSIRKPKQSNIYGLIFGSQHPLGIHKFLKVAWANDEIAGEANFDIDRHNVLPGEMVFAFDEMRPNKVRTFELDLEAAMKSGAFKNEADIIRFCFEAGMTCQHCKPVLKKLKAEDLVDLDFYVPDVQRNPPRPVRLKT